MLELEAASSIEQAPNCVYSSYPHSFFFFFRLGCYTHTHIHTRNLYYFIDMLNTNTKICINVCSPVDIFETSPPLLPSTMLHSETTTHSHTESALKTSQKFLILVIIILLQTTARFGRIAYKFCTVY